MCQLFHFLQGYAGSERVKLSPSASHPSSSCLVPHLLHQVCHLDSRTWVHMLAWVQYQPVCNTVPTRPSFKHLRRVNQHCFLRDSPLMPLHPLWTTWDTIRKIKMLVTPFLQTPHGCFPESSLWSLLIRYCMTFVLPAFIPRPFSSIPFFHSSTPNPQKPSKDLCLLPGIFSCNWPTMKFTSVAFSYTPKLNLIIIILTSFY